MLHPSYKELMDKLNNEREGEQAEMKSRYTLVLGAAKRARQINAGSEALVPKKNKEKNLSVAVKEFYAGKVHVIGEDE